MTASVPNTVVPCSTVNGELVARFPDAIQVAETRYCPGVRPVNAQVAIFVPVPGLLDRKSAWYP